MNDKQDMSDIVRTTVYIPRKIHKEIKKQKINLSDWVRENIEYEIYQDRPEYIERKLKELDENYSLEKNILKAKLEAAREKHQKRAERLQITKPETMDYRTITPSTSPPKKDGGK